MAYTAQTLVNDTYEKLRVSNGDLPPSIIPRLIILVPIALRLLPTRVRELLGEADAELYRKNYSVTLTDGEGSLSTHTDLTSEPMIPSEIVRVTHADAITATNASGRLHKVGSETDLDLPHSTEFAYYAVENNTLYTALNDSRTALDGTATVRAAYPPLIASVKFSHEPLLLEIMCDIARPMIAKAA